MVTAKSAKSKTKAKSKSKATKSIKNEKIKSKKKPSVKSGVRKKSPTRKSPKSKTSKKKVINKKPKQTTKKRSAVKSSSTSKKTSKANIAKASKKKSELSLDLNKQQKEILLHTIEDIVHERKHLEGGLKSFNSIERILDKYNQRFKNTDEKLEAIITYSIRKDREDHGIYPQSVYIPITAKDKEIMEFYEVLSKLANGKIPFAEAKRRMEDIYEYEKDLAIKSHAF